MYIYYFLILQVLCFNLYAQKGPELNSKKNSLKDSFYEFHASTSKQTLKFANWIDSFFGDEKELEEQNTTQARIYYLITKEESADYIYTPAFKIKLRLPRLKKKLQLTLENGDEQTDVDSAQPQTSEIDEDKVRAGLSYFIKDSFDFDVKLSSGIKLENPLDYYSSLKISRKFNLSPHWKFKIHSNSFWTKKEKTGQQLSFDFTKKISDSLLLRFINKGTWLDTTDEITSTHGPSIFHQLSKRRAIAYNFRVNYQSKPHYRTSNKVLSINYRQNIMKTWLYYEFTPFLDFRRQDNFKSTLGMNFKLELLIGKI